ncbi:MAG TPA: hypothetical protein VIV14_05125 [Gammaproteobacteria bacterium]
MITRTLLKTAFFITLLAFGYAGVAAAQSSNDTRLAALADEEGCEFPELPTVPEAEGATMEQMVATQGAIQDYMTVSNELLECLEGITNNEDLPEEDRQLAIEGYNAEVDAQESLAARWNEERTRFLEMQQQ